MVSRRSEKLATARVVPFPSANVERILTKLEHVRRSGEGWIARCPAHDDRSPSLSVTERDGKVLLHCFAHCTVEAVCKAMGLQTSDLFTDKVPEPREVSREVAQYDYHDENGALLYQVVRFEPGPNGQPKTFKQRRPDGHGDWSWGLGNTRRVLYRLPELLAANDIVLLEGEKDVETARTKFNLVATCNPMGAGKWCEEYSVSLRGKRVTIIADADDVGRKHAEQVAQALQGKATSVKVIELPGAKDLTEWKATYNFSREALLDLIEKAPEWKPRTWRQAFKSLNEMEQGELRFLVDRILPEGVTMIGALSGAGKTWFALSIAKALTSGKKFLGNFAIPEPTDVIYLIPEAGERSFRKRMERMGINDRFLCRTMKDGMMPLDDPLLLSAVHELKPVVFLDTAIRFSEADSENSSTENANGMANDIFGLLRAGAQAVIGLHHSPKASANQPMMTLENVLRGTGDLGAMCDAVYGLQAKDQETTRLLVKCVKPRDFEAVNDFEIQGRPWIDQTGDFVMLTEESERPLSLSDAIAANPTATYRELAMLTGIRQADIKDKAAGEGWIKVGDAWERLQ